MNYYLVALVILFGSPCVWMHNGTETLGMNVPELSFSIKTLLENLAVPLRLKAMVCWSQGESK